MLPRSAPSISLPEADLVLGLGRNWRQFALLVVVNAFVGGLVGLERSVPPLLAQREFGLAATSALLSFLVRFGVVAALVNMIAGPVSEDYGGKTWFFTGLI